MVQLLDERATAAARLNLTRQLPFWKGRSLGAQSGCRPRKPSSTFIYFLKQLLLCSIMSSKRMF